MELVEKCVRPQYYDIFRKSASHSHDICRRANEFVVEFMESKGQSGEGMCFVAVGSVGRREALHASDLDIIPVAVSNQRLEEYVVYDQELRTTLSDRLGIKVSQGKDLTKATSIEDLVDARSIGGDGDTSGQLTKRVLLLTESLQVGGALPIREVRERIFEAYASQERTSGRHVLALCNEVARYYKTLCVEYKAKSDGSDEDWCTRNVKLRHSRKLWYFSNIMSITDLAETHPKGDDSFRSSLLESFGNSPVERLAAALSEKQPLALGRLLESYALYLDFMSRSDNRNALKTVIHEDRYRMELNNPFPVMKFSSDIIHHEIMLILEGMGPALRALIMGWFLL
jgi:predicted nucleotidyltransferase